MANTKTNKDEAERKKGQIVHDKNDPYNVEVVPTVEDEPKTSFDERTQVTQPWKEGHPQALAEYQDEDHNAIDRIDGVPVNKMKEGAAAGVVTSDDVVDEKDAAFDVSKAKEIKEEVNKDVDRGDAHEVKNK